MTQSYLSLFQRLDAGDEGAMTCQPLVDHLQEVVKLPHVVHGLEVDDTAVFALRQRHDVENLFR